MATNAGSACLRHPERFGVWLMPDLTWRCDPCHDEPRVTNWITATSNGKCLCGNPYEVGELVAVIDTVPPSTVCEDCVE
jgi:hypothetical protein